MSDRHFGSILVVTVTLLYCVFFYFNCIIVPYTAEHGNRKQRDGSFISEYPVSPEANNLTGGRDAVYRYGAVPDAGYAETGLMQAVSDPAPDPAPEPVPDPAPDPTPDPVPGQLASPSQPVLAKAGGETGQAVKPRPASKPQPEQPPPEGTNPDSSRVLLSGSRAAKALSSLSFKDKLWLLRVLGRCSMEEFLRIRAMLEDGVTYQENLEMYRILRQKVTDAEQEKLDSLIESYTR